MRKMQEKTRVGSLLPEKPFALLPHRFLLKPLLITGKAMQYYGLRPDNEAVFLVPQPEFERLWEAIPEGQFITAHDEKGLRFGTMTFYVKMLGCGYYDLEIEAMEERDYFVLHFEFLLLLNTITLIHDPKNQQARQDMLLLLERLGVGIPAPNTMPLPPGTVSENAASLEGLFEEVKQITVTRLSPDVLTILMQYGCMVERESENSVVIFPEKTQRQLLLPPTAIERYLVVLADGLELRHEIDQVREISLLAVVF